jgi:hypothetical protein
MFELTKNNKVLKLGEQFRLGALINQKKVAIDTSSGTKVY